MSTSSQISLGGLRLQSKQRSDLENNPMVSDSEWNSYISLSYKNLYDMLISAYGDDYYVATPYQFTLSGAQQYTLPDGSPTYLDTSGSVSPKFYKLLGVDLQYSASPSGYVSLQRFEFIERNRYSYPNTTVNANGYTNLRYRISGNNLFLVPPPATGQAVRVWYAPAPTSLQFILSASTNLLSTSIGSMSATTGVTSGMNVFGTGIPSNTTVVSVATTSMVLSNAANAPYVNQTLSFWNDSTLVEGISGWEEFIIIDSAIKAQIKQESDITTLMMQKQEIVGRIEAMKNGRDAGQAHHVSDAMALNGGQDGGWGSGNGWGF